MGLSLVAIKGGSMAVYHYSPADVSITFAGKSISGFPDSGAFIEISRETPLFSNKRSMDGQVEIVVKKYSTYKVTITLSQSSQSNEYLSYLKSLQQKRTKKAKERGLIGISQLNSLFGNISSLVGKMPLIVKNSSGNALFFATDVWVESEPTISYSDTVSERVWQLRCFNATHVIAGQDSDDNLLEALTAVEALSSGFEVVKGLF